MSTPSDNRSNEFYVEHFLIRVYRTGRKVPAYLSVENKPVYTIDQAFSFDTYAEAYKRIKQLPKGLGLFDVEHIIEYLCGPSEGPCPELIKKVLDEIPLPYSISAVGWYEGESIKDELMDRSKSTYYRHRKKLLEYGINIGTKCNVYVIRYKWMLVRVENYPENIASAR